MIIRRRRHSVPLLNTVATADISFMLLIFFLVTTSMDTDEGMLRKLPPMDNTEERVEQTVEHAAVLSISLTADSQVLVDSVAVQPAQVEEIATRFIADRGRNHLISLAVDPDADYGLYFAVQNRLLEAYTAARDALALKQKGRHLNTLDTYDRDEVTEQLPYRITEK